MSHMRRISASLMVAVCLAAVATATVSAQATPVADAARRADTTALRTLLAQGADVNAPHGDGMTALHWAADRGDDAMVSMLVFAGANVSAVTRIGQYTPLHLAARAGSPAAVEALLKAQAPVSVKASTRGVAPLHEDVNRTQFVPHGGLLGTNIGKNATRAIERATED